jgi:hypothetical protein
VVVVVVAAGAVVDIDVPLMTEVEVVEVMEVAGNGGRLVAGVVSAPRQDATRKASIKRSQIRLISGEVIDGLAVLNLLLTSRRRWAVGGGRWARTGTR